MRNTFKQVLYVVLFAMLMTCTIGTVAQAATKPAIKGATTKTITLGSTFDPKKSVTAVDAKGKSLTKKIKITGKANTNKVGTYTYMYQVTISKKQTLKVKRKVIVKAKSYKLKEDIRPFMVKGGYGRHALKKAGTTLSLIEKSTGGWYKTSANHWIKTGLVGDYVFIHETKPVYATSSTKISSGVATYGISKVEGTSIKNKRIKIASGWITAPPYIDPFVSKGIQAQQDEILKIMNAERAKVGAQPLVKDETLSKIAVLRAYDMVTHRYFSHYATSTYGPYYTLVNQWNYWYWESGENIAAGASSAAQYMNMWMNSTGHKANILNKNYNRVGVGVVKSPTTGWYSSVATQVFAQP